MAELDKAALDRHITGNYGEDQFRDDIGNLDELQDDGDVIKLADGRSLRLRIEVDQDASINDFDCYGKVEWTRRNDYGSVRPDGFSGRARIIDTDYPDNLWWEPYEELTDEQIRREMPRISDLVRYGFKGVILELLDGTDSYGRPIVVNHASLWGIDSLDNGCLAEVIGELVQELGMP